MKEWDGWSAGRDFPLQGLAVKSLHLMYVGISTCISVNHQIVNPLSLIVKRGSFELVKYLTGLDQARRCC